MLTSMNFCLLLYMRLLFDMGSTLKGKSLLLEEQILSVKSLLLKGEAEIIDLPLV